MSLIEDYLRAVAILLPAGQREDIIAELRDTILTRIEAREAALGRALTEDETEAELRAVGHPLVVAARYRGGAQQVVGPALYPYWMFAVKVAITVVVALALVRFLGRAFNGVDMATAFGQATGTISSGVITLVGLATIAAWLIERSGARIAYLERWRVKDLRVLDLAAWDLSALGRNTRGRFVSPGLRRSIWRSSPIARGLSEIAIATVFGLWWLGALHFDVVGSWDDLRELGIDPDGLIHTDWAGLKATLLLPGLAYCAGLAALGVLRLARPSAARLLGAMDLAIALWVLAVTAWLWLASPL